MAKCRPNETEITGLANNSLDFSLLRIPLENSSSSLFKTGLERLVPPYT